MRREEEKKRTTKRMNIEEGREKKGREKTAEIREKKETRITNTEEIIRRNKKNK